MSGTILIVAICRTLTYASALFAAQMYGFPGLLVAGFVMTLMSPPVRS